MRNQGSLTPTTFEGVVKFANTIATSQMVPAAFRGKPDDILVAVQWGNEVGLGPMAALQNIAVINGKPSIYGDAMMALVSSHPAFGGCEETIEKIDGDLTAICRITRIILGKPVVKEFKFSQADAVRADLWGKAGPWKQYPKRMLQMRARGFALRDAFPDALKGIISKEEAEDMPKDEMKVINPLDALSKPNQEKTTASESATEVLELLDSPEVPTETNLADEGSEDSDKWVFSLPAFKEGEEEEKYAYPECEDWVAEFSAQIDVMAKDEHFTFEDRRHNLKVIKEANDQSIQRIKDERDDLIKAVEAGYKKMIRTLSAQAKEANNG
jgi:hypothetical protein